MRAIVRSFARLTNIGRDGEECCALEIPRKIVEFVVGEKGGCDLSQACNRAGIVADEKLGEGQGLIGILTKGRVDRKEYTMQAIKTSLIFLENRKWFC